MEKYTITLARIEALQPSGQVQLVFRIERFPISFDVPVILEMVEFDDAEMIEAGRAALQDSFGELASETEKWMRTAADRENLSAVSMRPRRVFCDYARHIARALAAVPMVLNIAFLSHYRLRSLQVAG